MFAPGRSLRTNDTVVRETPARAATSALVGRRREMANSTPGRWSSRSTPLLRVLTERPGSWTLTRVSDAYYYSLAGRASTLESRFAYSHRPWPKEPNRRDRDRRRDGHTR